MDMETTTPVVMVSLVARGCGVAGFVWRALDGRVDRRDGRLGGVETRQDADRVTSDEQRTAVVGVLWDHGERLDRIARRLGRIEAGLGDHAQRVAHFGGREEAVVACRDSEACDVSVAAVGRRSRPLRCRRSTTSRAARAAGGHLPSSKTEELVVDAAMAPLCSATPRRSAGGRLQGQDRLDPVAL